MGKIYDESLLNNKKKLKAFLDDYTAKSAGKLKKDPAVDLFNKAYALAHDPQKIAKYKKTNQDIQNLMRIYVKGIMEMQPQVNFFPDANLTLRVAYGHIEGFNSFDGAHYEPFSDLKGIMDKENPDIYDYVVEDKLKSLYALKDYGPYGIVTNINDSTIEETSDGYLVRYNRKTLKDMPVCFIATNHTTGGNSGSPVLNADGRLIGINFDRCWEGTMSDLLFDPNYCRNICLDIRYCLFIIDKFADAGHLIKEMTIVGGQKQ